MRKVTTVMLLAVLLLASGSLSAGGRPNKDYKDWFGHFGGGWSMIQGDASDILDDEWYFNGGATYWPTDWAIGIDLDLSWSNYEFSREAINAINTAIDSDPIGALGGDVTGGDVDIWGFTLNGQWSPMKKEGGAGFYITAGVGGYYLDGRLTDTGLVYYPPYCDPWYWWCVPGGYGQGDYIVASEASTKFGYNGGVGLTFEVGSGGQLVIEARYHTIDTYQGTSTDFVPLTIGYRW